MYPISALLAFVIGTPGYPSNSQGFCEPGIRYPSQKRMKKGIYSIWVHGQDELIHNISPNNMDRPKHRGPSLLEWAGASLTTKYQNMEGDLQFRTSYAAGTNKMGSRKCTHRTSLFPSSLIIKWKARWGVIL
ncbi:hypothetical protein ASPVEDRAFT_37777 [Aspergillus versicolor CBS 583.65]|uniref:Uncharacterized protein n=1 Tax=Aspergillus versicolor CBS 583.65 TaxID=1036611 RepID=A0A1L9PA43_ASPVE|nr:uncharacterized protein ASPVEDRAFT_37777 [Aspergillus versicolor CBS 583.65]OJI98345.1 hypothetical protein ASPVEDRAFT_37777 [Aspergillus versicolor CBS 583.65]